ncbi:hypothetical protein Trydic_g5934 [Trypoxylus dichotomus]
MRVAVILRAPPNNRCIWPGYAVKLGRMKVSTSLNFPIYFLKILSNVKLHLHQFGIRISIKGGGGGENFRVTATILRVGFRLNIKPMRCELAEFDFVREERTMLGK